MSLRMRNEFTHAQRFRTQKDAEKSFPASSFHPLRRLLRLMATVSFYLLTYPDPTHPVPRRCPACSWFFCADAPFPGEFSPGTIKTALARFWEQYDPQDDATTWFEKIKTLADSMGFATNMKLYKQNPDAWPGSVTDVSTFLRIALTGKTNSPDLYTVMQLLGPDRSHARIQNAINRL